MKNLLLPLTILALVALGCTSPRTDSSSSTPASPPDSHARTYANNAVADPKARYLGQATAYIGNLIDADKRMFQEFVDEGRTPTSIIDAIKSAAEVEKRDFDGIEKAPKSYSAIDLKLKKIHDDHLRAYTNYAKVFTAKNTSQMGALIDKGHAILRGSVADMDAVGDMLKQAMDRDVAH